MKKLLPLTALFLSLLVALPASVSLTYEGRERAIPEPEPCTETAAATEPVTEPLTEAQTEEPEETEPETEPGTQRPPVSEYETDIFEDEERYFGALTAEARTEEPQTELITETEPVTEPETEPETEPQTEPETEPETEPVTEPVTFERITSNGSGYRGCDAEYIRVYISKEDRYVEMLLGDYIVCVVTGEMPSRFGIEALKAQAIACRSFTLYRSSRDSYYHSASHGESGADVCTNSGHCQAYLTYEQALARWHSKDYTDERVGKIKQAVIETSGIVAAYDGKPIEALYHATSYEYTENYNNNWGGKRPYLCAVETPETLETNHIVSTDTFSSAEVMKILKKYGDPVFPEDKNEWFKLVPNDSGRVGKSNICGILLNGQALRGAFSLASSKFTVTYNAEKDEFVFDVRGWGHGVGLSQYGAGIYADMGYDCEFIIHHYYTNVDLILWE